MKGFIAALIFLAAAGTAFALDYEPRNYHQDFGNGELNAWSSYPPVQDTAYEAPFIYPGKALPGDTGISLCKIIYPQTAHEQMLGAVKKLALRLDSESRIRFRYCVKATVEPAWLGIDLPLADGNRIRARFPAPPLNRWIEADYRLADLFAASGTPPRDTIDITALAITAGFDSADPAMPIMFGLDDVDVTGGKTAGFFVSSPDVTFPDERREGIALKHFRAGDAFDLRVSCESPRADKVTAKVTRFDHPDSVVAEYRLTREKSGGKDAASVKLDAKTYPPGVYEVTLTGYAGKEETARTVFAFMVIDEKRFARHPRFLFTGENVGAFKSRLETKHPDFLAFIRDEAKGGREKFSTDLPYDLSYFPDEGWLRSFEAYRTRIATIPQRAYDNALLAALDKDDAAAVWAKTALVNLCRWPTWTHPWMQKRGHHIYLYQTYTTAELALVYDLLYDRLSKEERRTVQEAFLRNGLEPAYHTYVLADMVTNNESNWITAIVGGSLMAGCAVIGDMEDSSALEPYLTGCLYKLRDHMQTVYSGDSGFIEGFSYGLGTMRHYADYLPIIEKTLGLDFAWMFENECLEALWAADHDHGLYFTFGDAHLNGGNTFACLPWLIERFRDGNLAWLYSLNRATPAFYTLGAAFAEIDDVAPVRPELSGARLFKTTGTVVFRSDNGPEPFVFTFRCGPFGNHQHIDQGTFYLQDGGETLVTEFGYSDYYDDPYYQSHVIQPVGQNCILIDGNTASQRTGDHAHFAAGMNDRACITSFVSGKSLAWAGGDLSAVYTGTVKSLTRGVLYIAPRTVILLDRLVTKSGEATMDALFHGPKLTSMKKDAGSFAITSGPKTLTGTVLMPAEPVLSLEADKVKLSMFTDAPIEPLGKVSVSTATKGGTALSAIMLSTGEAPVLKGTIRSSRLYQAGGATVLVNPEHEMLTNGPLGTDGVLAALRENGALLVVEGTVGAIDNRRIFHADCPMTVMIEDGTVSYTAPAPSTIHLAVKAKPTSVLLDGKKTAVWQFEKKTAELSIIVEEGKGKIEVKQ